MPFDEHQESFFPERQVFHRKITFCNALFHERLTMAEDSFCDLDRHREPQSARDQLVAYCKHGAIAPESLSPEEIRLICEAALAITAKASSTNLEGDS